MSCKTSIIAILVHAAIFAAALYYIKSIPLLDMLEPFEDTTDNTICYTSGGVWVIIAGGGIIGIVVGILSTLLGLYIKKRMTSPSLTV